MLTGSRAQSRTLERVLVGPALEIEMTTTTVHVCSLVLITILANAGFAAESGSEDEFHLKGVLVSQSQRSALIEGAVLQEGERVGNIELLAIRVGEVDVRRGSSLLTVPVGSKADWNRASPVARSSSADNYGPIKPGETLSEIAETLLVDDVTLNQMIIALYDTNQDAFSGNINVLREGAILRVPDKNTVHRQDPTLAAAKVVRQTIEWRESVEPEVQLASASEPDIYGPVARGENLSSIAANLPRNGATINQMMVALFETNPQGFDDNINLLKEGAVLQIPDRVALHRHSYEMATAAVVRHMKALELSASRPAEPTLFDDELMTWLDRRLHLPGAILF